ncbi:MAG: hypothetical protein IKB77_03785 [Lentisphaeria bacterium]|nr:hypothetical protein [Lentisphaeria bacterium]
MKTTTKLFTLVCALGSLLLSAETVNLSDASNWSIRVAKPVFKDGKIIAKSGTALVGKKAFVPEAGKTYTLSMEINRIKEDAKNPTVLFGFEGLDANGKVLPVYSYQYNLNSVTELAADAKKGDTQIRIKKRTGWFQGSDFRIVADAKEDNSDIPNTNLIANGVKKIVKDGEVFVVTLNKPLVKDVASGTKVRQHLAGGYFYFSPDVKINTDNVYRVKSSVKGFNTGRMNYKKGFPKGVSQWRLVILANWNWSKAGMELANINWTVE